MEQGYLSALERQFLKSEYISIAKKSFRMLTTPSRAFEGARLFCFVLKDERQDAELLKKLADYANSVAFYDGDKKERVCVIALFEAPKLKVGASRESGALILPCAFDTENNKLLLPDSLPILRREEFKKLCAFVKNIFKG